MRELREFRESHHDFESAGVALAGVSRDSVDTHHAWIQRLRLPYPLLSDPDLAVARTLGLVQGLGVGGWQVELYRRTTLLVDADGVVAAVWGRVKTRGHARNVLEAARLLTGGPAPS